MQFDFTNLSLDVVLAQLIAFFTYAGLLAGAVQVTVNQLKPVFFEPFKAKLDESQYLVMIYAVRTALTVVAYFTLWNGVEGTRQVLPQMAQGLPDAGVAAITIMFVVMGQEVLHAWISRLYEFKEAAKALKIDTVVAQPTPTLAGTVEQSKTVTVTAVDESGKETAAAVTAAPVILG